MSRFKTFDATGLATAGRIYAGDLNAIQDLYADIYNLTQALGISSVAIGEAGLQLLRYGAGEARLSGHMRVDGILRGLGGLFAGAYTSTARDAIPLGTRPFTLVIFNTTTNQFEYNAGTDVTPNWQPLAPSLGAGSITATQLATNAVTAIKVLAGIIDYSKINDALKPSVAAATTDEALRALGTGANTAAAGNDSRLNGIIAFNAQTGSYTLVLADGNKLVETNVATANNITVPPNSSVAFPVGTTITLAQYGVGQTTIVAGAGVTIRAIPGLKLVGQYAMASLIKRATDEWYAAGNLST